MLSLLSPCERHSSKASTMINQLCTGSFFMFLSGVMHDSLFKTTYWIMILDTIHIKRALNVGTIGNDIAILGQPAGYLFR